jgi:hypothetical protein
MSMYTLLNWVKHYSYFITIRENKLHQKHENCSKILSLLIQYCKFELFKELHKIIYDVKTLINCVINNFTRPITTSKNQKSAFLAY